jgi:hypothetical protein
VGQAYGVDVFPSLLIGIERAGTLNGEEVVERRAVRVGERQIVDLNAQRPRSGLIAALAMHVIHRT